MIVFDNIHSWLAPFLQQFISSEKLQMQTDRLWLVSPGVVEWQWWWDGPAGPDWTPPSHPAGCWPSLQQGTGRHWCWKRRGGTKSEGVTHHHTPSRTTSTPPSWCTIRRHLPLRKKSPACHNALTIRVGEDVRWRWVRPRRDWVWCATQT